MLDEANTAGMTQRRRRQAPGRKDSYVQSLAKGLDVLEAFSLNEDGLTIARGAELTGLDRAGARRLFLTLEHLGYVVSDGRRFRLTARVLSLGYRYLAGLPFWRVAQPVMEELAAALEETVSVAVLEGTDAVFVWRVPGRRLLTFDPTVGMRVPAHVTSVGHILLAALDENALKSYLGSLVPSRYTDHTVTAKAELRRQIREAGRRGWSHLRQQYETNFFGVAVPIVATDDRVVAGLHVGGVFDARADRRAIDEILPRMRVAAMKISGSA
jgi:IclR family pca regulon transcriptional regulator